MTDCTQIRRSFKPRLWWWIVAALVLHLGLWIAWFMIAAHHPVVDVPLAAPPGF